MAQTCTVEDLKKNPGAIINQVKASKEPVYIDQNGSASVMLVEADAYLTDMQALGEFRRIYSGDVEGKPLDSVMAQAIEEAEAAWDDSAEELAGQEEPAAQESKTGWRCTVCGYIIYADELPDDFTCPVCGVGKEMFEKIE